MYAVCIYVQTCTCFISGCYLYKDYRLFLRDLLNLHMFLSHHSPVWVCHAGRATCPPAMWWGFWVLLFTALHIWIVWALKSFIQTARERRLDSRGLQDNTDATWSLHHRRDIASIALPITCLSAYPSITVQSRDLLHRVAKSGRYLYLEEAILHNSVHKGRLDPQLHFHGKHFKEADETFGLLSYWDNADWEDLIYSSKNCFCVCSQKGQWGEGDGDSPCSLLCLPSTLEEVFGAAVGAVVEMQLQPDVLLK